MRSSVIRSFFVITALAGAAHAHIGVTTGAATATKASIIGFAINHGCTDANNKKLDTLKVKIDIPAGVTSVRAVANPFGKPTFTKDGSGNVTSIEWTKPASDLLDGDDGWYEIKLRATAPDAAFSKLKFVIHQTCEDSSTHAQLVVDWDAAEDSTVGEPAPFVSVMPAHGAGWNKMTVPRDLTQDEVATYLGDALIVWKGTAAYSHNGATAAMIASTPGVTALDGLTAGDEIWVKY
jgi:uncharacterized protein YcnI